MKKQDDLVGNKSLISDEEAKMADYLREKNLKNANRVQRKVHPRRSFYTVCGKRMIDIILSSIICIITAPFNLVFAGITFFDVGSPILFKQARCGKDGKPFILIKFRNMNNKTDKNGVLLPAKERVTPFGNFMRKYSLDELLNFWSVLKGDMSIIGPRPLPMFFRDRMSKRHRMREAVRPGLECPRVLKFDEQFLCNYHKQFENDIWYVENISLKTDLMLCWKLFQMVFDLRERGNRAGGGEASYFVGYDEEGHALSMNTASEVYSDHK